MLNRSATPHRRLAMRRIASLPVASALVATLFFSPSVQADTPVPAFYSSRPGAAYTLYLDFGGFSYSGHWAGGTTPGDTPAYSDDNDYGSFSAHEVSNIQQIWSGVAAAYAPFSVNVTTVDPAVAAGQTSSDDARQQYYDTTVGIQHTIVGGTGLWAGGGALGESEVGGLIVTAPVPDTVFGIHANFVFANQNSAALSQIAGAIAHEDGHAFNLNHQSDYKSPSGPYSQEVHEYSAGTGTGPGSVGPIMGLSTSAERALFAVGASQGTYDFPHSGVLQNDDQILASAPGIGGFINDGIGHTRASATPLPKIGSSVDFNLAKGVIVPVSISNPAAVGSANYQPDYWSFTTTGGLVSLTANSGEEYLTPGIADPGATLKTLLTIYNSSGNVVATSPTTSLSESISTTLAAGTYYASVTAVGDALDTTYDPRYFFDQGPFFLTGTVPAAVPGDFNGNGVVDAADYVVWRNGLGTTYTQSDYNTWRSISGKPPAAALAQGDCRS